MFNIFIKNIDINIIKNIILNEKNIQKKAIREEEI